jgi:hypothetical protein
MNQDYDALRLFKALRLLFLSNFPGSTFIPCPTSIPDSRVYPILILHNQSHATHHAMNWSTLLSRSLLEFYYKQRWLWCLVILFTLDQGVVLAMKIGAGCSNNLTWAVFYLLTVMFKLFQIMKIVIHSALKVWCFYDL